ncbi:MAG: hypothetical protein WCI04_03250 [archaeon]
MTLAVPNDLKEKMDSFKEINWSEVARQSFERKIKLLELLKNVSDDSNEEKLALEIGKKINKSMFKRYKKLSGEE